MEHAPTSRSVLGSLLARKTQKAAAASADALARVDDQADTPPAAPDLDDPQFRELFDEGDAPRELDQLLDVAKFQVDFQLKMAERLDSKARGLVTITAAFAGAVQAFTFRSAVLNGISAESKYAMIILGAIAALVLGIALIRTAQSVLLRNDHEVEPQALLQMMGGALQRDRRVTARLAHLHLDLAWHRKKANDDRVKRIRDAEKLCLASLGLVTVEFVLALATLL